ncbi:MAG TPA: FkbM family methyltransferase, partial [Verrucomicrobiae bacterium]|nr:FkbM family methyltransferase [Verrucomicrobiae bacterium]
NLLRQVRSLVRPGTTYVDIGANIGLMSVPILATMDDVTVWSFEPSPANLPYLRRTFETCSFQSRWRIIPKAASDRSGQSGFYSSAANGGALDGLKNTGRIEDLKPLTVECATVDQLWAQSGKPAISCVKVDVEGAELMVLKGAERCLSSQRPPVLLEWNATNLMAYGCAPEELLSYARAHELELVSCVHFTVVTSASMLRLAMQDCENFLLMPR